MSTPLDQLYAAKRQAQVLALQKQRDAALQGYQGQLQDAQTQFNQQLPTYQTQRNAADANAFRTQQGILERAAALGNYRAGSTNTALINAANQANQNIADITDAENRFRDTYNSNVAKLRNAMQQAENDYNSGVSSVEQQIAAELAQAKQQELQQQQQAAARVSRASAPKQPSVTELKQAGWSGLYDWVANAASQNMPENTAIQHLYDNAGQLAQYGFSANDIANAEQYIRNYYAKVYNPNRFRAGGYTPV